MTNECYAKPTGKRALQSTPLPTASSRKNGEGRKRRSPIDYKIRERRVKISNAVQVYPASCKIEGSDCSSHMVVREAENLKSYYCVPVRILNHWFYSSEAVRPGATGQRRFNFLMFSFLFQQLMLSAQLEAQPPAVAAEIAAAARRAAQSTARLRRSAPKKIRHR